MNGENISLTTTAFSTRAHLFLRKVDTTLHQIGDIIQLTFDTDSATSQHITDHKHLFLNGFHFVTFSVAGDSDLYIFKTDLNGKRVGGIVPVVRHTANRTNDMMFCTDGTRLFIAYFNPVSQSIVHVFDQDLREIAPPLVTSSQLPHNNLGGMVFLNNRFYMFTGDKAGPNSSLILTIWNQDWTPAIPQPMLLLQQPPGEGYFFATGISYDSLAHRWYVGFHHVKNINPDSTTHIDIAVFDQSFVLIEQMHTVSGFRPHFLLLGNNLFSVFDRGGVHVLKYSINRQPLQQVQWKQYFTLDEGEGKEFVVDTVGIAEGGVPVINISRDNQMILHNNGNQSSFVVSPDGRIFAPVVTSKNRPSDGGVIYLPDGRMRFLGETFILIGGGGYRRSRVESSLSYNGIAWTREPGIRYQPGIEDDSISSVVSFYQVRDSIWRMYYVGDFKNANGTRTALSSDWGYTWQAESKKNILKATGDVDPQPVYLSNGRMRLYFRTGFNAPHPSQRGIAYCESEDGLHFDTTQIHIVIPDNAIPASLKLDPWVVKFPNRSIGCFVGAAPSPEFPLFTKPKLIVARGKTSTHADERITGIPTQFELLQNYPNPFNPKTVIEYTIGGIRGRGSGVSGVRLAVFDILGREVAVLVDEHKEPGTYSVTFDATNLVSGVYLYRLIAGTYTQTRTLVVMK